MSKVFTGRYFEDFRIGQQLVHAVPRTLHGGDISSYFSLTGDRHPLASSTELARSFGFQRELLPDLLVFHVVFGKSVGDISHNATANVGYADVRFLRPVYPGDTLVAESEVIGLREVSSGEAGVVYVRTRGTNQKGQEVLSFVRWVMIPKRDKAQAKGVNQVPTLPAVVTPDRLPVPDAMNLQRLPEHRRELVQVIRGRGMRGRLRFAAYRAYLRLAALMRRDQGALGFTGPVVE